MNISSKFKKIISFMFVSVLIMSAIVLPVSAEETTTEDEYVQYIDLSNMPEFKAEDLDYTGKHSDDVSTYFNLRQEYDMSAYMNEYYTCIPFKFYWNLDYTTEDSRFKAFDKVENSIDDLFTCDLSGTLNMLKKNYNFNVSDYDVYYVLTKSRSSHYGMLQIDWYYVPHGKRLSFVNQALKSNLTKNKYGVLMPVDAIENPVYKIHTYITGENYWQKAYFDGYSSSSSLSGFCSYWGPTYDLIATNMPVFDLYDQADAWRKSIGSFEPSNKVPEPEPEEEKVGADAFYWDSLKCRISQQGQAYNFVYDYSYSVPDMVAHPEEYAVYTDYSQVINFKMDKALTYQQSKFDAHSSFSLASSNKSVVDTVTINKVDKQVNNLNKFLLALDVLSAQKFLDTDFANAELLSAHIYVTVTLVHIEDGGNGLSVKDKVSSDVRTFKFDATTLESLDSPEEIKSDVKVDDVKDENGKVIDRTVSQVVTNDNSTHQTINNYYYDSDGNRKESSGSSIGDSLSDIASGLINFIKTLVTEGLPAALEVLKTLIKSISDLIGFAVDQIGDIGQGASNGLIAVLKAIPVPLWGICSVGLIVFVVVGVVKKIF